MVCVFCCVSGGGGGVGLQMKVVNIKMVLHYSIYKPELKEFWSSECSVLC